MIVCRSINCGKKMVKPRRMNRKASVTIKLGSPVRTTMMPLTAPMAMRVPSTSDTFGGRASGDRKLSESLKLTIGLEYQENQRDALRYAGPSPEMVGMLVMFWLFPLMMASRKRAVVKRSIRVSAVHDEGICAASVRRDKSERLTGQVEADHATTKRQSGLGRFLFDGALNLQRPVRKISFLNLRQERIKPTQLVDRSQCLRSNSQ